MTRKEYMQALGDALAFMDPDAREALLDFYEETLCDRMEDGMDEASAVAAMEDPRDIAARLRTEQGGKTGEKTNEKTGENVFQDDAMKFSSLADQVLGTVRGALEGIPDALEAAKMSVEEARKKAEDYRQAAQSDTEEEGYERRELTCPVSALRQIRMTAWEMPFVIRPCEGENVTLVYYTFPKDPYEAWVENGVLTLEKAKGSQGKGGRFFFSFGSRPFQFIFWSKPSPTVELFLPRDALVDLLAHTSNASIKIGGFSSLCDVELKTSNSRIAAEDLRCKSLRAESSNGRLVLKGVGAKRGFACRTSNARIEAGGLEGGEDIRLKTSNGRIAVSGARAGAELELTTSNSRIQVEALSANAITMKTSNGNISGVLPGSRRDWRIDSGTVNGRNSLPKSQPGEKPLSAHTANGNLDLKFEMDEAE